MAYYYTPGYSLEEGRKRCLFCRDEYATMRIAMLASKTVDAEWARSVIRRSRATWSSTIRNADTTNGYRLKHAVEALSHAAELAPVTTI